VIRWILFLGLASGLVAYAFWLYLRVEMSVPWARRLAAARALALVILLALLFDVRLPAGGAAGSGEPWVLLDASLSMAATAEEGGTAWDTASARAAQLADEGWRVVTFGSGAESIDLDGESEPSEPHSMLAPALQRAAEAGARRVRVLSDLRLEDQVAVRAALASLPIEVEFERFGGTVANAGITELDVPDLARPEGSVTAEIEIHAAGADSLTVRVSEEDRQVAEVRVAAPSLGLRSRVRVDLPTPLATGRVRYSASVSLEGDGFPSDDVAVRYASVGHEEGALVLISLRPDWEPRHLLPVLEEVTGLPAMGYLRAASDRFLPMGRALDRGTPVDSAAVGRAALDAAVLVLHGFGVDTDAWARSLVGRPGRKVLFPADADGSALAGVPSGAPRPGEWYASADLPSSPIAGALSGTTLQGLPPLSNVLLPDDPAAVRGALLVQLRGAGAPEAALHLDEREGGRVAVILSSGFWRWSAREGGREAYRRIWSGVVGWLLADQSVTASEVRPTQWVVDRGEPVTWAVPSDSTALRLVVSSADSSSTASSAAVVDTTLVGGGSPSVGVLPPGAYAYRVEGAGGQTVTEGRFDVASATAEMAPAAAEPSESEASAGSAASAGEGPGSPLRTRPWPYLLVIGLLCAEWIGRRRSGLR
jgi:hypothetical protein